MLEPLIPRLRVKYRFFPSHDNGVNIICKGLCKFQDKGAKGFFGTKMILLQFLIYFPHS